METKPQTTPPQAQVSVVVFVLPPIPTCDVHAHGCQSQSRFVLRRLERVYVVAGLHQLGLFVSSVVNIVNTNSV